MIKGTLYEEVSDSFYSHPQEKFAFPEGLVKQFFKSAVARYSLDIKKLEYDDENGCFVESLPSYVVYTLGCMMYAEYLTRQLNKLVKLNGFTSKDLSMTGIPASKTAAISELQNQLSEINSLIYKQKTNSYSNQYYNNEE